MRANNPFTTTPGVAGEAYIDTNIANEIIKDFESGYSAQYLYKILGQRGSGKSVEYAKVMNYFACKPDEWKVYGLSSGGDPIQTWLSALSREPETEAFVESRETAESFVGSGKLLGLSEVKGSVNTKVSKSPNHSYFSDEDSLENMCVSICNSGFKILVGIDDIAKTQNTVKLLSVIGKLLLNGKIELYFICTGLYKNIEDFTNEAHLSFFVRPASLVVSGLGKFDVSGMYRKLLGVDTAVATALSEIVMGYAWGYQLLGYIYYNMGIETPLTEVLDEFDRTMAQMYELIWNSMTDAEQKFVKIIVNTPSKKREDIEAQMEKSGYDSLRQRLYAKHILDTYRVGTAGYVKILLPRFKEFIDMWH